jgi:uncharacterized protein (TIGR02001 family)
VAPILRAVAVAALAGQSLVAANTIAAHAQTRDDNAANSVDLGNRGGIAKQTPAAMAAPLNRQDGSVEFSARVGFATDYVSRGTTESAHRPAAGAVFEAAFNHLYAGAAVTSVKLPS